MERFWQKQVKLEELTQPSWGDAADYFREREKKYGSSELKVPAVVTPQSDDNAAVPAPTTFAELIEYIDSVPRISQMPQVASRPGSCHITLGSGKPQSDIHQQNIFQSLEASRSVWEDLECNLRYVDFRRVSDTRSAFRPALGVTGISDDLYSSTMGGIVISLRTPHSAGEDFECSWEHLWVPATSLWAPTTSLGAAMKSLEAPTTSLGAPRITVKQSGKHNIFFGNVAGAPGNHSYYLVQRFLKLMYSVCILIYLSI